VAIKITPLDQLFSERIRRRAIYTVGGCERCLKPKYDIQKEDGSIFPAWKQLQCAHFDGRGNKAVRYDDDNAAGLCFYCHSYLDAHAMEKVEWIKQRLGEDKYNNLLARMRIYYPKPDQKAITLYLKERIKQLRCENG